MAPAPCDNFNTMTPELGRLRTPYSTMQSMADLAAVKTIELEGADLLSGKGFTQVPNHLLKDPNLSPGAKLAYAMLLSYAWHNDFCYPGQERRNPSHLPPPRLESHRIGQGIPALFVTT